MQQRHSVVILSAAKNLSAVLAVALLMLTSAFAQKKPPAKPLDLNIATQEQFEQLPGVGPVTAKAIVDFRKKGGPFRRTSDLLAVRGISEKRFKQIQSYVMVSPARPVVPVKGATPPKPAVVSPRAAPSKPAQAVQPKQTAPGR